MNQKLSELKFSWLFITIAVVAAVLDYFIVVVISGFIAQYYREKVVTKRISLIELISFHPFWKYFTVIYYFLACIYALTHQEYMSQIGAAQFVLLGMFPLIVPLIKIDYVLFKQLQKA